MFRKRNNQELQNVSDTEKNSVVRSTANLIIKNPSDYDITETLFPYIQIEQATEWPQIRNTWAEEEL